jgi:hypothetical protein
MQSSRAAGTIVTLNIYTAAAVYILQLYFISLAYTKPTLILLLPKQSASCQQQTYKPHELRTAATHSSLMIQQKRSRAPPAQGAWAQS